MCELKTNKMIHLIREISKLCMFTVIWALPIVLARMFGSGLYLWFFVVSFIVTTGIFDHFEDLEKIDGFRAINDGEKESE